MARIGAIRTGALGQGKQWIAWNGPSGRYGDQMLRIVLEVRGKQRKDTDWTCMDGQD